jgi:hypothetical protein
MKTLSIGDIHGQDGWKFITHAIPYEFENWKTAVQSGADPADADHWKDLPYMAYDKIIFVGDYVDSFTVGNPAMLKNLEDIIFFKKALPEKVVLLLGNHDVQYFVPGCGCSGFRPEMKTSFEILFLENLKLFQLAYSLTDRNGILHLWTHAGVSRGWYQEFLNTMNAPDLRYSEIFQEADLAGIAEELNFAWELRAGTIFNVDRASGGYSKWAGPLWVRPPMLDGNLLSDTVQIVGHTPQKRLTTKEFTEHRAVHHYIDCLEYGSYDGLELEVIL